MAEIVKSTHKNAARSRYLIKQAFAQVLNEKDLGKITVTDVVERANISRGTFYAHYIDVYDLSVAIQNNVIQTIDEAITAKGVDALLYDPTDVILEGMTYLEGNRDYFKLFVTSAFSDTLITRIVNRLSEKFLHELEEKYAANELNEIKMFLTYSLGAFEKVIIRWFNDEFLCSAEQCAAYLSKFYLCSKPMVLMAAGSK